jgi:hypothetical protein
VRRNTASNSERRPNRAGDFDVDGLTSNFVIVIYHAFTFTTENTQRRFQREKLPLKTRLPNQSMQLVR